jgi:serine/threonine protein kinase
MIDLVGRQIGNYRLTRLLGSGNFADVYLGEHLHLDMHQAAIKVLRAQLAREDMERFRAEARVLAHLAHPGIVRLLDYHIEGGHRVKVKLFRKSLEDRESQLL